MEYTILDLEWNSVYSKKRAGYFNEVIQYGAVRLNAALKETGRFATFVRPVEGTRLTGLVEELTGITNEDVQAGATFSEAYRQFRAFADGSVLMTWGDGDVRELVHNCAYHSGDECRISIAATSICRMCVRKNETAGVAADWAGGCGGDAGDSGGHAGTAPRD